MTEVKRATAGFIVSLIGGIIDAIVAILMLTAASLVAGFEEFMPGYGFAAAALAIWVPSDWS